MKKEDTNKNFFSQDSSMSGYGLVIPKKVMNESMKDQKLIKLSEDAVNLMQYKNSESNAN